jgi:voltage-dependent calcium channel
VRWTSLRISYQDFLPRKRPPVRPHAIPDLSEPGLKMDPSTSSTFQPPSIRGHTSTSSTASGWRVASSEQGQSYIRRESRTLEAPFQLAIEKQRSLAEQGRPYLRHSWNRIDFVSILSFWIMFALSVAGIEATPTRHIYIFRALSVLRISRLLGITSGTAVRRTRILSATD